MMLMLYGGDYDASCDLDEGDCDDGEEEDRDGSADDFDDHGMGVILMTMLTMTMLQFGDYHDDSIYDDCAFTWCL